MRESLLAFSPLAVVIYFTLFPSQLETCIAFIAELMR